MLENLHLQPLNEQRDALIKILRTNNELTKVLQRARELDAPSWYVGAGAISQTVWNYFHEFSPTYEIKDYDLVYFDSDTSYEAEDRFIQRGSEVFKDVTKPVEIRNQARVHLWYKKHFGYDIPSHTSTEHAITTWPTTATAVGVRLNSDSTFTVFAPYGLHDLLGMIAKPNKVKITEKIYLEKVDRWQSVWPQLKVVPW